MPTSSALVATAAAVALAATACSKTDTAGDPPATSAAALPAEVSPNMTASDTGPILVRVMRCGHVPKGALGRVKIHPTRMQFGGTTTEGKWPQAPGTWFCAQGWRRMRGKPAAGPWFQLSYQGVVWMQEQRHEVADQPTTERPLPQGSSGSGMIFFGNSQLDKELKTRIDELVFAVPKKGAAEKLELCRSIEKLIGDPEPMRAQVIAYQQRYLETGKIDPLPAQSHIESHLLIIQKHCRDL